MAHKEQINFINKIKIKHPDYFNNKIVLGVGTFDVCGTENVFFNNCDYKGLDLSKGLGVDIVCPAQEYNAPNNSYDTIISCECFEHNPFYKETIQNIIRLLKSKGLFLFTCATTNRPIHGIKSLEEESKQKYPNWKTMPNVTYDNWDNNYYKNLTEYDIRECIDVDAIFSNYKFEVNTDHCDLYFWGIKK
jgi:SAM-dependent methyltransferase